MTALNAFNPYNAAKGYFEMRFKDDAIQKVTSPDRIYFAKLYYGSQDMIGKLRRLYRVYDANGDSYSHFIFMLDNTFIPINEFKRKVIRNGGENQD